MHLYLGNVVLMGIFVFPDPDPDLSGGAGPGAGPSSLPGPGPRTRPKLFPPGRRACWIRGDLRSTGRRQRRNSVRHGTLRRRACRRAPTVHVRVDSSS